MKFFAVLAIVAAANAAAVAKPAAVVETRADSICPDAYPHIYQSGTPWLCCQYTIAVGYCCDNGIPGSDGVTYPKCADLK